MAQYLDMLRSRGVPVEDMSVESFGTLGAYGGFKTLETVHPLDFAIRLSDVSHCSLSTGPQRAVCRLW